MQAMRAASASVQTNIGVLTLSAAHRSHWRSSGSMCGETIVEDFLPVVRRNRLHRVRTPAIC